MTLLPTSPSLEADLDVEGGVPENAGGTDVELSCATITVNLQLHITIEPRCMLYNVPFQRQVKSVQHSREDFKERGCCEMQPTASYSSDCEALRI